MILSDTDITKRLGELNFRADNPNFPFDAARQIQPASVDLRLSEIIWVPRARFRAVDLSDATPLGPQVNTAFRKKRVSSKGYVLHPGKFVLGRTYETFAIPHDLSGQLRGRSSLGRLGLSVVAPSNFINPGWHGHMPLMIINHSPFKIRLHPYLGIVQLSLIALTSKVTKAYGEGIGSKYIDDDGGPSKYWLDQSITALHNTLHIKHCGAEAEAVLTRYWQELDEPTRKRFERKIKRTGFTGDPYDFLNSFHRSETWRVRVLTVLGTIASFALGQLVRWLLGWIDSGFLGSLWINIGGVLAVVACLVVLYFQKPSMAVSELRGIAASVKKSGT